ncbi:MAG: HAMP domain-containing sensor histidine kinase [Egibacteraceae bacterium]
MRSLRSLRGRVAVAAVAATAVAFLLLGTAVVGTFAGEEHWAGRGAADKRFPGRPADAFPDQPADAFPAGDRRGQPRFVPLLAGRFAGVGVVVLGLVGAAGLALGDLALRPLRTLREGAERVASTRDLATRLPSGDGPEEVDALAGSLNEMLARLQRSTAETEATLEASRRFAADAGHELRTPLTSMQANLEVLEHATGLTGEERRVLGDVLREQRRIVLLLDALQALARGDAAAAVSRESFDLVDVVDASVEQARTRNPHATIGFTYPEQAPMSGWPQGIRVLVDNLLANALRHGRPDGRIDVSLAVSDGRAQLTVDDDGPGIPAAERERVFERFVRGRSARGPGSGLGLALVAQQARLHHGTATLTQSPLGGTRATVSLGRDGLPE